MPVRWLLLAVITAAVGCKAEKAAYVPRCQASGADIAAPNKGLALGVGLLTVGTSKCSAALIRQDVVLTAQHCLPGRSKDSTLIASITFEAIDGADLTKVPSYDCLVLARAETEDAALLRCGSANNLPGAKYPILKYASDDPIDNLYMIHQGCDDEAKPECSPLRRISKGHVRSSNATQLFHDAAAYHASSGAPLFSEKTNHIVAVHRGCSPPGATMPTACFQATPIGAVSDMLTRALGPTAAADASPGNP